MTLVLSAHKRDTVFQVSDRLVSVALGPDLRPLDVMTNKTVLYLGTDGIVAIGFSGRARLEGKRTDLWVAEQLAGMDLDEDGSIIFIAGGRETLSVYVACELIREEANRVFDALKRQSHTRHTFVFSGWQRRRRNEAQPFLWRLDNSQASPSKFEMTNLLRDSPDWLHKTSFTPVGSFSPSRMDHLMRQLTRPHSRESFEEELVAAIRSTASELPGVGRDCLSIQIRPDADPNVRIRFFPPAEPIVQTRTVEGDPRQLPFIFSPWIVGRGTLLPPNLLIGQLGTMEVGGLSCAFESPYTSYAAGYGMSMHSVEEVRRSVYKRVGQ